MFVKNHVKDFWASEDSIIFGCAGVKSMLDDYTFITGKKFTGVIYVREITFLEGNRSLPT